MRPPFVIDNEGHCMADVLNALLDEAREKPFDVATAYFSISGYRLVQEKLHHVGSFRLLIGSDPQTGADVGLKPNDRKALEARLKGDLEAIPFTLEALRLVEQLIAFLRADKVEVRLFDKGFLHAKAYIFHHDRITPHNRADRMLPYAAIVGSSNFTGPGLATNRELNIVHRVFTEDEEPIDWEAARSSGYLRGDSVAEEESKTLLDPTGVEIPPPARLHIKSEVGARAISDLTRWFERQWAESSDFKDALVELLDASKFGAKEYTPYEIYMKALYEYFKDELGEGVLGLGRTAVELTEFQEDAYKKAHRILDRYDGVLIADSVGLGKTWIGKRLLEDFAYHRRQKAVVVCPASLRDMWRRELLSVTISADVVGMEEMGREGFDPARVADADIILVDESHNFRNDKSSRYLTLDAAIQMRGGKGIGGERKKVILLSATPINNDVYDLQSQVNLFAQGEPDYFRAAGIGDLPAYFRRARRLARNPETSAGVVLFNLLEEIIVRNTRPFIRAAYPNATMNGERVSFPDRSLHTVTYDLGAAYGGLYDEIVTAIDQVSLAPYKLEAYRRKGAIRDEQEHEWETGRENALVGIFKTRYLKRLESSVEAFRLSLKRALAFEETYLDYLLDGTVVASMDYHKAMRFLSGDQEDDLGAASAFEQLEATGEAKAYIEGLPRVDLNEYQVRRLTRDVERDVKLLRDLYERTAGLAEKDGKLVKLKQLLAGELKGKKVLIFSSFMDTSRYVHAKLAGEDGEEWRESAGNPVIRRIDSGNSPSERTGILARFAPVANGREVPEEDQIGILISTDVLSEGQNIQDCGVVVNYDLTWNPVRLVQRNGRIDRLKSPHARVHVHNMFPEEELEQLLHLVERLATRISVIDDLGLLDASILGEAVHPRTFNVLRRIRAEDGTVLDEEEARAELAGPEVLLRQLKALLNREGAEAVADLPNGIHSGLRRDKCYGMFFYFQAPRPDGEGKRHFWRYIDARSQEVLDNRFEIAQIIDCQPDEPRYIGDQDVFALQEKVIEHILAADMQAEAKAAIPKAVHPVQRTIAEELKDAIRRDTVDREVAKTCISFLGQPVGKAVVKRFTAAYDAWEQSRVDAKLLADVAAMEEQFGKEREARESDGTLRREDLELVCFEHVSE